MKRFTRALPRKNYSIPNCLALYARIMRGNRPPTNMSSRLQPLPPPVRAVIVRELIKLNGEIWAVIALLKLHGFLNEAGKLILAAGMIHEFHGRFAQKKKSDAAP